MPRLRVCWISPLRHVCFAFCLCVICVAMDHAHAQNSDPANVGKLGVDEQARWIANAATSGTLAALDNDRLAALFRSLDPLALPRYLQAAHRDYASYEFTMRRRERIKGKWPKRADHMLVRVAHEPLRTYAK